MKLFASTYLKISVAIIIFLVLLFFEVRIIFNQELPEDLLVYFNSSSWIYGSGTLYKEVPSEYPLLANLIFSIIRFLTFNIDHSPVLFSLIWAAMNSLVLLAVVITTIQINKNQGTTNQAFMILAWLLPSTIYFSLFRYDIYPAATSLLMMWFISKEKWLAASLWLGVTIALKGYAIFLLPTFFIYLSHKTSLKNAIKFTGICLAPFLGSLIIVIMFSGIDGLLSPFKFHANREINSDSTYQLIRYYFSSNFTAADMPLIPFSLQILCSILGALFKPKNFQSVINCFAFVILGFISFSTFYSPQFLLWLLPILSFSNSLRISKLSYIYALITLGYLFFLADPTFFIFKILITTLTFFRFFLMWELAAEVVHSKIRLQPHIKQV